MKAFDFGEIHDLLHCRVDKWTLKRYPRRIVSLVYISLEGRIKEGDIPHNHHVAGVFDMI